MAWIIGDIHGEKELLLKMLDRIKLENQGKEEEIYSVGDIIDRGDNILDCIDICIERNIKCVLGNHEDMCIDFYFKEGRYDDTIWYYNGGDKTNIEIHTLINSSKDSKEEIQNKVDKYITWMKSLPLYYILKEEDKQFLISHAGIKGDLKLNCNSSQPDIIWRRKDIRSEKYYQIVGHCVKPSGPIVGLYYANIDTGSCFTGKLSAIHIPSMKTITVNR